MTEEISMKMSWKFNQICSYIVVNNMLITFNKINALTNQLTIKNNNN